MTMHPRQPRATNRAARCLLLSLLPMLSFMGHWPTSLPIPGTSLYVSVPLAGRETPVDEGKVHSHGQHCHGDSAGCSDVPASAGAGFAMLSEALPAIGLGAALIALALLWWRPATAAAVGPELRPPRTSALSA